MKKALIYTSVASMIEQFNMENIKLLRRQGYQVDVACNFKHGSTIPTRKIRELKQKLKQMNVTAYHIPIPRKILSLKRLFIAFSKTKKLFIREKYDLIHCHSPIGGVIARIVNKVLRTHRAKLVYTAHGFHFHNRAPLINWILYYPIERILSKYTDVLITINKEDYHRAKKSFKSKEIYYIPGVGIDTKSIQRVKINKNIIRSEIGVPSDAFVILSVGELNDNKNHKVIVDAIKKIDTDDIFYVICGIGDLDKDLKKRALKEGIDDKVLLLGYKENIIEIMKAADIFAFPSKREGLGVAALEAMASGLPLITSNVHGIVDYSIDGETGFCFSPDNVQGFADAIKYLYENEQERKTISLNNVSKVKKYDIKSVNNFMENIYQSII